MERKCDKCIHKKEKGCEKWNCEFEPKYAEPAEDAGTLAEQKKGKWIRHEERKPLKYGYELIIKGKCSNCGEVFGETYKMNYCPNCGAEMESEE